MVFSGFLMPAIGVVGMLVFSVSLFFNVGLIMVWLYLELCGLCLIPLFFSSGFCLSMSGLFYYVVFSGVSSCLLLLGFLLPDCIFFLLAGFLMKFGIFPLWGWVYRVCCFSNWFVVWGFSTILKVSFILFPLFLVLFFQWSHWLAILCGVGCFFISFLFWFFVYDWKVFWCHVMLSSSSVLVGLSLSGCGVGALFSVFGVYFIWSSLVLLYFSFLEESSELFSGGFFLFFFCFLLLTLPFSLSIFYKVLVCSCVFSSGLFLLFCWVFYSLSEQFYLFLYLTGLYSGKFYCGFNEVA